MCKLVLAQVQRSGFSLEEDCYSISFHFSNILKCCNTNQVGCFHSLEAFECCDDLPTWRLPYILKHLICVVMIELLGSLLPLHGMDNYPNVDALCLKCASGASSMSFT